MTTIATFPEHLVKIKTVMGNIFMEPEFEIDHGSVRITSERLTQTMTDLTLKPGHYLCVFDKILHVWFIFFMGDLPVLYVGASSVNPQSYGFMERINGPWKNKYFNIEIDTVDVAKPGEPYYQRTGTMNINFVPDEQELYIHYQTKEAVIEHDKRAVFSNRVAEAATDVFELYVRDLTKRAGIFRMSWAMTPEQGGYLKREVIKMFADIVEVEYATSRDPDKEHVFKKNYTFIKDKFDPENVDEIWNAVHGALKMWYALSSDYDVDQLDKPRRLNVSHGEGEFMVTINFNIKD